MNNWYVENLEDTPTTVRAMSKNNTQIPWILLPVGQSIPSSSDSTNTKKVNDKPTKSSKNPKSIFNFKFKQSDYGDVCTLINIINVLDYIHDEDSVSILEPYLDESIWATYTDTHDITNQPGYELSALMQLLQRECHY